MNRDLKRLYINILHTNSMVEEQVFFDSGNSYLHIEKRERNRSYFYDFYIYRDEGKMRTCSYEIDRRGDDGL